jgi:hypothetical protein
MIEDLLFPSRTPRTTGDLYTVILDAIYFKFGHLCAFTCEAPRS